jgi:hypothetical protein
MDYLEKYRELIEVTLDRCCQMNARHVEVDREIEVTIDWHSIAVMTNIYGFGLAG